VSPSCQVWGCEESESSSGVLHCSRFMDSFPIPQIYLMGFKSALLIRLISPKANCSCLQLIVFSVPSTLIRRGLKLPAIRPHRIVLAGRPNMPGQAVRDRDGGKMTGTLASRIEVKRAPAPEAPRQDQQSYIFEHPFHKLTPEWISGSNRGNPVMDGIFDWGDVRTRPAGAWWRRIDQV
jgi:hypothetical protein